MGRSRGVIRRQVMRPTRRSSNGVEDFSDLARCACFVFQHSLVRELYGVSLLPAPDCVVAHRDDINGGFQRFGAS